MSRSSRSRLAISVLALTLGVSTVGCGKAAEKFAEKATEKVTEKAIEAESGGDANVDIGKDGKVQIDTEDGSLSIGTGEIPDSWPSDVPLPEDLDIVSSLATQDGSILAGSTASMNDAEVMEFYEEALGGWTASSRANDMTATGNFSSAQYEQGERVLSITATGTPDESTAISISYTETSS